jgi:hypothetical protein
MSTRGCIARVEGDGFRGVYHHFDSYPTELGRRLFALAQGQDLDALLQGLIDDHPAGWLALGEECFCHDRHRKEPMAVTQDDHNTWVEWAYAFDAGARSMAVLHTGVANRGACWRWSSSRARSPTGGSWRGWRACREGARPGSAVARKQRASPLRGRLS